MLLKKIIQMLENKELTATIEIDKKLYFGYSILPPSIFQDYNLKKIGE